MAGVSSSVLMAAAFGVLLGLGLWTLVARIPRFAAPRLSRRLAVAVADLSPAAREVARARRLEPGGLLAGLAAPVVERIGRILGAVIGGDDTVARLLRQAGLPSLSVRAFRGYQLAASVLAGALGLAAVSLSGSGAGAIVVAAVVVLGVAGGVLVPERVLAARAARRRRRIEAELPVILDLLVLALSAGQSIGEAVERVSRVGGELASELAHAVAQTHAGTPLPVALEQLAADLQVAAVTRSIEHLVAALERGSALAEVLRAQADDARDASRRQLMEAAGTQEVAMMVPLVLMILPVTIAFALAPAVLVLELAH